MSQNFTPQYGEVILQRRKTSLLNKSAGEWSDKRKSGATDKIAKSSVEKKSICSITESQKESARCSQDEQSLLIKLSDSISVGHQEREAQKINELESIKSRSSVTNPIERNLSFARMISADPINQVSSNQNFKSFGDIFARIGIHLFNKSPKVGIAYLIAIKFIDKTPQSVADFFKYTFFISKDNIGEILGSISNCFCKEILDAFKNTFDFKGYTPDAALRTFQNFFRMPGEAQKINAIMEAFAEKYIDDNAGLEFLEDNKLNDVDSILVLAFAIMMLNTDQHNPSVVRKMSLEEFVENLEGVDSCRDIPRSYLEKIYSNLAASEFAVGNDHTTQLTQMTSIISGKGMPTLVEKTRQFIGVYHISEVKNNTSTRKESNRTLFLFSDIIVIARLPKTKVRNPFATAKKQGFYTYVKSYQISSIIPSVIHSENFNSRLYLYSLNNEKLATFECFDSSICDKLYKDLQSLTLEDALLKHVEGILPKNIFQLMTCDVLDEEINPNSIYFNDFKAFIKNHFVFKNFHYEWSDL